jgi:hypothetical protein
MVDEKRLIEGPKPAYTMDSMFFQQLNNIGIYIDSQAIVAKSGNLESMINWKSGLEQFYTNIQSFLTPETIATCQSGFEFLDRFLSHATNTVPKNAQESQKVIDMENLLNRILYTARNQLLLKFEDIFKERRVGEITPKTMGDANG